MPTIDHLHLNITVDLIIRTSITFRPKRYMLCDLVTWFYALMRKDEKWGFRHYDMKYDPVFPIKVWLANALSPAYPYGGLHWESLEKVNN